MLETTPWVLHAFTLVLHTRTHTLLKLRVWVVVCTATINYPSRRTKKQMNDDSKQRGVVDRTLLEQQIRESAVITLAV